MLRAAPVRMPELPALISMREIAERLDVSESTARRMLPSLKIPFAKNGERYLVNRADFYRWCERGTQPENTDDTALKIAQAVAAVLSGAVEIKIVVEPRPIRRL